MKNANVINLNSFPKSSSYSVSKQYRIPRTEYDDDFGNEKAQNAIKMAVERTLKEFLRMKKQGGRKNEKCKCN